MKSIARRFEELSEQDIILLSPRDTLDLSAAQARRVKALKEQARQWRAEELRTGKPHPRITGQMRSTLRWEKPR